MQAIRTRFCRLSRAWGHSDGLRFLGDEKANQFSGGLDACLLLDPVDFSPFLLVKFNAQFAQYSSLAPPLERPQINFKA